jgi:hypothetical protein
MSVETFLSRLHKVKATGRDSWIACCPAHDDKTPSLSIRNTQDGRTLINCFAGCSAESVIGAVGIEWKDIEPPKPIAHSIKPERVRVYASDALKLVQFESRIVVVAANEMLKGKPLDAENHARLLLAMERINTAVETANV